MKTLYFDCSSGIAGNMILGALLDLGVAENYLRKELKKIPLPPYKLIIQKVERNKIKATFVDVELSGHHHDHHHYNLKNIIKIIDKSKLAKDIKKNILIVSHQLTINAMYSVAMGTNIDEIVELKKDGLL